MLLAHLKHFFLPQESNNFRAKILHHQSLSYFSVLFLAFQLVLSTILLVKPVVLGYASQISPEKVIELTNQERAKVDAPALKLNSLLNEAAQRKAGDMFAFDYWAHSSPSGRDPWTFFKEVGYRYLYAGENLARDFSSPEAVVSAWMASPTHRENILNPKYQEIGISVVDGTLGGTETTLVVQFFGTPVSPVPVAKKPEVVTPEVEKPQPLVFEIPAGTPILSRATGKEKALTNPFLLTKNLGIGILGIIVGVMILDGAIVFRRKTWRLSGRSLAHTIFLTGVILIIILSTQGAIL
ncbi:MAG: CAP domain-containing protein [Patescibacteria group bacterium]